MHVAVPLATLVVGLVAGTLYGRKVEQKIVGTTLAEYNAAGRISVAVMAELHARLTYLRKYVAAKIA